MVQWLKLSVVVAVLLGSAAVWHRAQSHRPGIQQGLAAPTNEQRRRAFEECREAAHLIFDVHWAVACLSERGQPLLGIADGHPECELPDEKAAVVNRWLDRAEASCTVEMRAGLHNTARLKDAAMKR